MKYFQMIVVASCAVFMSGCDLGTYSSRYNDRVGGMTVMANSNKDMANEMIDVAGAAKIRVPKVCLNPDSVKYTTDSDYVKARLPGIEIDGFVSSYMGDKESSDGNWYPFQVYLFYMSGVKVEDAKDHIKEAIGKVMTQRVAWDSIKVEAYDGKVHLWETAELGANQTFFVWQDNADKRVDLNGRLDFYVTGNESGSLVVAFRAPTSIFGVDERALIDGTLKSIQGFN